MYNIDLFNLIISHTTAEKKHNKFLANKCSFFHRVRNEFRGGKLHITAVSSDLRLPNTKCLTAIVVFDI